MAGVPTEAPAAGPLASDPSMVAFPGFIVGAAGMFLATIWAARI
jgi:hypothetical protein